MISELVPTAARPLPDRRPRGLPDRERGRDGHQGPIDLDHPVMRALEVDRAIHGLRGPRPKQLDSYQIQSPSPRVHSLALTPGTAHPPADHLQRVGQLVDLRESASLARFDLLVARAGWENWSPAAGTPLALMGLATRG